MAGTPTVLIIEDSPTQAYQVSKLLSAYNIFVIMARDGEDGLRMVDEHKPDALILDVRLPKIDGYEVCKRIRSNPDTHFTPIIMFTSADAEEDRRLGLSVGADEYIYKGSEADEQLIGALHRLGILSGGASN